MLSREELNKRMTEYLLKYREGYGRVSEIEELEYEMNLMTYIKYYYADSYYEPRRGENAFFQMFSAIDGLEGRDPYFQTMQEIVDVFNAKHQGIATATITFTEKMPMFEKNEDEYLPILFEAVARKVGLEPEISSFHAGAETHIYANKTNSKGEKFSPYLLGLATVCNMHSAREYVDYKSMLKGQELLQALFEAYNK